MFVENKLCGATHRSRCHLTKNQLWRFVKKMENTQHEEENKINTDELQISEELKEDNTRKLF